MNYNPFISFNSEFFPWISKIAESWHKIKQYKTLKKRNAICDFEQFINNFISNSMKWSIHKFLYNEQVPQTKRKSLHI